MPRLVALDQPTDDSWLAALRRIWDRGDAVLPIDQRLPRPARDAVLAALRPHEVWRADSVERLDDGIDTHDGDALVISTSGSTGEPKGVVHTVDGLRASADSTSRALGVLESDKWLACLPVAHIGGFSVISRALLTGTPLEIHDGFDAERVASSTASLTSLVAATLSRVDTSRFRRILLGGSRPPADRPANCVATYGMTETGSGVVYDGWANPNVELRVVDGEVQVRGPMLMRAYRDGTTTIDADGWLHTGDAGRLDDTGRLHVDGRIGDVIVTGGEKVWPEAVERVLAPHVGDFAIVAKPDPEWGQRVVFVHVGASIGLAACRDLVKAELPAYCAPTLSVRVSAIPRTASGKVQRRALADVVRDAPIDERH